MYCPACRQAMSEVAPGLWQCGYCGAGPNSEGFHGFWAMFNVEHRGNLWSAICIEEFGEDYKIFAAQWETSEGKRLGQLECDPPEVIPRKGSSEYPLPVKVLCQSPAALLPGVLSDGLFQDINGPKEVVR